MNLQSYQLRKQFVGLPGECLFCDGMGRCYFRPDQCLSTHQRNHLVPAFLVFNVVLYGLFLSSSKLYSDVIPSDAPS